MTTINKLTTYFFLLTLTLFTWGCVDQDFDEPPVPGPVVLDANTTIAQLKALHNLGDDDQEITDDIIIRGVVVADDQSGNFFKSIIIQDETGGLEVRLNAIGLYNEYPIGREVFIKCQGLYIGDFNGTMQLNGSPGAAIEEVLIRNFVFPGELDQTIEPKIVSIGDLNEDLISTLVMVFEAQFADADVDQTYADADNRVSINRTLVDCDGNTVILRSSGFADFANDKTPGGNGSITAIYSVFRDDKQLFIRDTSDVVLDGNRCNDDINQDVEFISVETLREDFANNRPSIDNNRKISGIVISDWQNENTSGRNLVVQDGGRGIVVRFTDSHDIDLGSEVEIVVSNKIMSEFNGLLQIDEVNLNAVTITGTGNVPEPKEVSIQEVLNNAEAWESTEVKISNVSISGGSIFSGNLTIEDSTGAMILFTRGAASFANTAIPSGRLDITAVVSQFNDPQLFIRNLNDIGDSAGPPITNFTAVNESFSGLPQDQDITLDGWVNVATKGSRKWVAEGFSGNSFAQATAFQDNNDEMEAWLVTPAFSADTANVLAFRSAQAFYVHDGLSVWISDDFDGSDVTTANWTQLFVTLAGNSQSNYDWVESGNIDLSNYSGTVHIAFKYTGNKDSKTTTFRIDDVVIK